MQIPDPITREWLRTVGNRVFRVYPSQLFITPAMQERMKRLAEENEVTYFPETVWKEDELQRVNVDRVKEGRLCVVDTDNNLLKLIRWTHPLGLNTPKVPVSVTNTASKPEASKSSSVQKMSD